MATVKLVDELRETFTECSICMAEYKSPPKMLTPCLHTFCLACLETHASCARRGDPLLCPTCRTPVAVPDAGLAALPTNFFVNRLRDNLRRTNTVDGEACAVHADKPACFLCRTCNEAICAGCMLTAGHRSHDCVEIDEAADSQKEMIVQVTTDADDCLGKLRLQMTSLEGLKAFAEQLLQRGSKTEFITYGQLLKERLDALTAQPLDDISDVPTCLPIAGDTSVRQSLLLTQMIKAQPTKMKCSFVREFSTRNGICDGNSLAVVGEEFYICARSSGIDVYSLQGDYKRNMCDSHFRSVGAITPLGTSSFAVCDRGAQVVFKLSASGDVEQMIGKGVLKWPVGVATNELGQFLVTDVRMKCVHVFSVAGVHRHSQMAQFERPLSVAVGPENVMIVTDAGRHKVQWISASGELLHCYGSEGKGEQQFGQPLSVIRDLSGHVLVSDNKGHRVHRLTSDGTFMQYVLTEEDGIEFPNSLFFDAKTDKLYVGQSDGKVKVFKYPG